NVNFASKKAFIRGGPNLKGAEPLLEAVEKAGYGLKPLLAKQKYADLYRVERMRLAWRVVVGGLLVLPFLLEHLLMGFLPFHLSAWQQLVLAFPLWGLVGWPFHQAALRGLRHGEVTMDTLVSLGSSAAFLSSLPAVMGSAGPVYFEASAFIVFFVALGRYLELLSRQKANRAMEFL